MITGVVAVLLALICAWQPLLGWLLAVGASAYGIAAAFEQGSGVRAWVFLTAEVPLGILGLLALRRERERGLRVWAAILFANSTVVFLAHSLSIGMASAAGGFLGAFMIARLRERAFWRLTYLILASHLALSAAIFWLPEALPALQKVNGALFQEGSSGPAGGLTFAGELGRLGEGGVRGVGVYYNQNAWAQVSGAGLIIGCAVFLWGRGRMRAGGVGVGCLGLAGLLGSMGRAALLGAAVAVMVLVSSKWSEGRRILRVGFLLSAVVVGAVSASAVRNEFWRSGLELGSDVGESIRIESARDAWANWTDFALAGDVGDVRRFDPHDLLTGSFYFFGSGQLAVVLVSLIGGIILCKRWLWDGIAGIAAAMPFPEAYRRVASGAAVPLFLFMVIAGVANGVAGKAPYMQLFLLYGAVPLMKARRTSSAGAGRHFVQLPGGPPMPSEDRFVIKEGRERRAQEAKAAWGNEKSGASL